jgi:hypothetical protein
MPDPVSVIPVVKLAENVFKTAAGTRRRKRKGLWLGVKIRWVLAPSEVATLDSLLAAENADTDAVPFTLSVDGTTYRRAGLSKEPEGKPPKDTNVAWDVTLEFEFYDRLSAPASPSHLGATS